MAFEKYILPDSSEDPKLDLHLFRAIIQEKIEGEKNNSECLAALEAQLGVSLSANEISDLQIMLTAINAGSTVPDKMSVLDRWYRIFTIAEKESRYSIGWYDTKAKIKTRLVLNDD